MKIKLDENIGNRGKLLFAEAGHEVATIVEENLQAASDLTLIGVCQQEQRCLVTLDLDFSNPLRFDPSQYAGIAVLRLPNRTSHQDLLNAIATLIAAFQREEIYGKLWIVRQGRIRVYQPNDSIGHQLFLIAMYDERTFTTQCSDYTRWKTGRVVMKHNDFVALKFFTIGVEN
jgi:predicted nuclease of predicted toxin-antitoxin system